MNDGSEDYLPEHHQTPFFLQGFVNHIHEDEMYAGLTGTITWDSSKVPPDSGFTFCVWPAQVCESVCIVTGSATVVATVNLSIDTSILLGTKLQVLFDLQAHPASMVMIPGDVMHGTPGLSPTLGKYPPQQQSPHSGQQVRHAGIGCVIFTPDNMSLADTKKQMALLDRRMRDPAFRDYGGESLFSTRTPIYCTFCGEGGRPVPCGTPGCAAAGSDKAQRKALPAPLVGTGSRLSTLRRRAEAGCDVGFKVFGVSFEGRQVGSEPGESPHEGNA